jgi:tetratricopeptide (TPR) repeat protein
MTWYQTNTQAFEYMDKAYELGVKKNRKDRRYLEAIEYLNKAIEIDPQYITALSYRSFFYYHVKQYEKCIADVYKIFELTELNPDNYAEDYWLLGDCYLGLGKYDEAISNYSKSIEYDYYSDIPLARRGYTYTKKGQFDLAIKDINEAIKIDPKSTEYYMYRADYYIAIGNNDLASADLKTVIKLSDDDEERLKAKSRLKNIQK